MYFLFFVTNKKENLERDRFIILRAYIRNEKMGPSSTAQNDASFQPTTKKELMLAVTLGFHLKN